MTTAEQANAILAALGDWVANNKGRAFLAADEPSCLEQLRAKPGAPSAAVLWLDEKPRGHNPEEGKVLRAFKIVISRGRGLSLLTGDSLTKGAAGGEPMFDLIEQARETIRSLRMDDQPGELQAPIYHGAGAWRVHGYLLDAYEIRFALFADIPQQTKTTAQTDPDLNPGDTEQL